MSKTYEVYPTTLLGAGTPDLSASGGLIILPLAKSKEDVAGAVISVEGSGRMLGKVRLDVIWSKEGKSIGLKHL